MHFKYQFKAWAIRRSKYTREKRLEVYDFIFDNLNLSASVLLDEVLLRQDIGMILQLVSDEDKMCVLTKTEKSLNVLEQLRRQKREQGLKEAVLAHKIDRRAKRTGQK